MSNENPPFTPTANSTGDGGLREEIFGTLVEDAEALTPSQIGDRIDSSRQTVKYHLDVLVNSGLVVRDGGEYYCQPVFIDPEFDEKIDTFVSDLIPHVEDRVYVDPDLDSDAVPITVSNCLRMAVAQHIIDE